MKSLWDNETFCEESFADDLPNELKEETVTGMLRAARRSRRERIVGRGFLVAALVTGILLLLPSKQRGPVVSESTTKPFNLQIVRTERLPLEMVVHTFETQNLIVRTESPAIYDTLTDEEMLEIFRDRGVALVKVGNSMELHFLSP